MPDGLNKLLQPFMAMPSGKRWMIVGVVALTIGAFALLIFASNRIDYRPLFTNLTTEDAGEIVRRLQEQKIPYQIGGDGRAILVPSDRVYELRLSLASDGLPQGGGVGFEIFDRKNFGMTEFVQKLNYQRAMQGELSRTIGQLSGVDQARVHLVVPEKSLFAEQEKPATASVVLRMKGARILNDSEVQGIVHLVASAVEGMTPEHVTVLDSRGKILSRQEAADPASRLTSSMIETQRGLEKSVEDRLQTLLDKVVGSGKSAARVSATLDFRQVEKYEEKYDPENSAVRSEQRREEKAGGAASAAGAPGVQSNLGRTGASTGGSSSLGSRSDETLNYEVSRLTARTIEPVGTLTKLSVAILVDGRYEMAGGKSTYQPRTPEELQQLEALVKSAVGFNADRGDQVTVANIAFQGGGDEAPVEPTPWWESPFMQTLIRNGVIAIAFLLLIFLVLRPLVKSVLAERSRPLDQFDLASFSERQLSMAQAAPQVEMRPGTSQSEVVDKVRKDSYQAAQVMRNWLQER
jgi:flagellar M-ring protein FliF